MNPKPIHIIKHRVSEMLNKLSALCLAFVMAFGSFAIPVLAQTNDKAAILAMLQERDKEVKSVLGTQTKFTTDQKDQLRGLINDVINFESMSKAALGSHWDGLTPDQQTAFVDVFSQIVRLQSLGDLDPYRAKVTYGEVTIEGNKAKVETKAVFKDVPTQVDYDLERTSTGWQVVDIWLDDVGTVDGYARSFQSVIRKRGFDALMKSLNRRLEKMKQK